MKNREKIILLNKEKDTLKARIDEDYKLLLDPLYDEFTIQELINAGLEETDVEGAYFTFNERWFRNDNWRTVRFKEGQYLKTYGSPTRSICDIDDLEYFLETGK